MRLRTLFLISVAPFVFVGAVIVAVLAVAGPDTSDGTRPAATVTGAPSATTTGRDAAPVIAPTSDTPARRAISRDDQLHQDYNMTQYMSGPTASGPMFTGQLTDAQLEHSSDPAFVRELEQHQRDIDRMLARGEP